MGDSELPKAQTQILFVTSFTGNFITHLKIVIENFDFYELVEKGLRRQALFDRVRVNKMELFTNLVVLHHLAYICLAFDILSSSLIREHPVDSKVNLVSTTGPMRNTVMKHG